MASVAEAQNYRNFIPLLCALSSECHGDRKEGRCAGGLSAADLPLPIRPPSPSATEFADGKCRVTHPLLPALNEENIRR